MSEQTIAAALVAIDTLIAENRKLHKELSQAKAERSHAVSEAYAAKAAAQYSATRTPRSG